MTAKEFVAEFAETCDGPDFTFDDLLKLIYTEVDEDSPLTHLATGIEFIIDEAQLALYNALEMLDDC